MREPDPEPVEMPPFPVLPEIPPPEPEIPAGASPSNWIAAGLFSACLLFIEVSARVPGADPWLFRGQLYAIGLAFGVWWIRPRAGHRTVFLLFFAYVLLQGAIYAAFWITLTIDVTRNGWPIRLDGFLYPGTLVLGGLAVFLVLASWIPALLLSISARRWLPLFVAELAGLAGAAFAFAR